MNLYCLTATCGRHTLLERSLRFFIDQDYSMDHTLLIYNNSDIPLSLSDIELPDNKHIILYNNHIDTQTGIRYSTLGGIYNDIINLVPPECDIICHTDDDDIFLPNHISEGMKGLRASGKIAYKPEKSYYRHPGGMELMGNNLEPSVFVRASHIREHGYSLTTTEQHMAWFNPLLSEGKMFVDPKGTPTLIYNWGDTDIPTFKTSGDMHNPRNFENYRAYSRDHGDRVLTPWSREDVQKYYDLVK